MPAPSEFYVPLSASGGPHRAEPGVRRARQLQPLVRWRAGQLQRARSTFDLGVQAYFFWSATAQRTPVAMPNPINNQ